MQLIVIFAIAGSTLRILKETQGKTFVEYARSFVHNGIEGIAIDTMRDLNVGQDDAETIAPQIADAFIAHYEKEEHFTGDERIKTEGLGFMGSLVVWKRKDLVYGLRHDLPPADNSITIDLQKGSWGPESTTTCKAVKKRLRGKKKKPTGLVARTASLVFSLHYSRYRFLAAIRFNKYTLIDIRSAG